MTDQIPADKVREIIAAMRAAMRRDTPGYTDGEFLADMSRYVRDLEVLLPAPPLPTLADMTDEERRECRRMQCDVEGRSMRYVIANPHENDGEVTLLDSDGGIDWVFPEYVTPRPDLPRLTWPGDTPSPSLPDGWRLADHKDYGRVIVTNTTPNRLGNVYFVAPTADYIMGYDCHSCDPEELTCLEQ